MSTSSTIRTACAASAPSRSTAKASPTRRRALIDNGVLTTWLLDCASARSWPATTGHAARGTGGPPMPAATNLYMEAGTLSPAELMADIKEGFYVTELIGMGVNGVTGDYSRGAAGFLDRKRRARLSGERNHHRGQSEGHVPPLDARQRSRIPLRLRRAHLRIEGMTIAGA